MKDDKAAPPRSISADRAMGALVFVFWVLFLVGVGLVVLDQQRVIDTNNRLKEKTIPAVVRYQSMARNLDLLRQEGDRIFSANTLAARQQSLVVVTLLASHPVLLEQPQVNRLAHHVETFLNDTVRSGESGERRLRARYEEWQHLSAQLEDSVEDVSSKGMDMINADIAGASEAIRFARLKLAAVLMLVGFFVLVSMSLLRRQLIDPLQRIGRILSNLSAARPAPDFPASRIREIQLIEASIREHHELLVHSEENRQALEQLANKDGLTGLMNRRCFMQAAEIELQRAQRYRRSVTMAMADLDFFKRLNDTYGHAAGDAVLRAFAERVRETLRQSDLLGRYGGEEFAFLFPEVTPEETRVLAERLRACCADNAIVLPDGREVVATVSIGLADASECTIEEALRRADEALYEAKRQGRNRVVSAADATGG